MPDASKMFIVRKYVKALSVSDAIKKEKHHPVDDVFIDDEWRRNKQDNLAAAIGFKT